MIRNIPSLSSERQRRGTIEGLLYEIKGNIDVPNYTRFLKFGANKESLAAFLSEYICENGQEVLSRDSSIVLAGGFADGEVVKVVHGEGVSCLEELESTQKEVDTRLHSIVIHAEHVVHSASTESFAVCRTAVALKHNVYDDRGLHSCSMLVTVYYQIYCIRLHFS